MQLDNPLIIIYDALWDLLESSNEFKRLVRPGNRIRFDTRDPIKSEVQAGDLPEVRIVPVTSKPHLQSSSSSTFIVETFEIQISTGDLRYTELLFPVKWAIYCAMANWMNVLRTLKWHDKVFVLNTKPNVVTDGASKADMDRRIVGWASVWSCEVMMCFATTDMIGEL